jgi:hypothetical protein
MPTRCLAAFTASDDLYPAYINASLVGDHVDVTVRAPATPAGACGETLAIAISAKDFDTWLREAAAAWNLPAPRA